MSKRWDVLGDLAKPRREGTEYAENFGRVAVSTDALPLVRTPRAVSLSPGISLKGALNKALKKRAKSR
jgi:hypothetical protein